MEFRDVHELVINKLRSVVIRYRLPLSPQQSPVNRKIYRTFAFYAFGSPPFFWSADFPLLNNQVSFLNLNVHIKFIFHDYLFRSYHLYKYF